ncbi:hypothetical protein PG985_013219 [Apiospora marii]|uniref:Uncharacterized protein n=1 Tax=Apiospora marii TaxID=335849 RepID=A0ABR1R9C9_9PEZI
MGQKPSCHEARLLPQAGDTCWSPGPRHPLTIGLDRRPEQLPGACQPNLGGTFSAYATYVDLSGVTRDNVASGSNPRVIPDGHGGLLDFGDFVGEGEAGVVRYRDIMPHTDVEITLLWTTRKGDGSRSQTFFYKGERILEAAAAEGDNLNAVEDTVTNTTADSQLDDHNTYPKCHM